MVLIGYYITTKYALFLLYVGLPLWNLQGAQTFF